MSQPVDDLTALALDHALGTRTVTPVPGLTIWRHDRPTQPIPALFEPKVYLLLQGTKRITIGDRTLHYAAGDYSVSSVGLPFAGEVTEASPARPYLGVELRLDARIVADLLLDMDEAKGGSAPTIAVHAAPLEVVEPIGRLLRLLASPHDISILAPLLERELVYRLLRGPMAGTLGQLVQSNSRFAQIRTAVEWICDHANEPVCVARLAASVGMSVTSFHRHFKAVTAHSPLAYQRSLRLLEARRRLASDAARVTGVALECGYASPSQFSREYKRMFGVPPVRDARRPQRFRPSRLEALP